MKVREGMYGLSARTWSFFIFVSLGYDLSSFGFGFCFVSGHDFSRAAMNSK